MKKLQEIINEAKAKGLTSEEVAGVERAWVEACVRYEREAKPPTPGIVGAITYIDNKFNVAYAAASLYIKRVIDEIQRGDRR